MEKYMHRAIELAKGGIGFVNPNPLVGAVIVKNGKIIGEGFHRRYGELHAERNALLNCRERGENPRGADMYVTLEPCCHYGKNPPCTDAVIQSGIKRVFVGSSDPNPLVAGKGVKILRDAGIEVTENVLRDECDAINKIFFHYITTKTPYVILKNAITADGKIASSTGDSRWITNEKSRALSHLTRKRVSAILVGVNTVITDNPMLNCRCENPSNPIRIICDTHLRIPLDSAVLKTAKEIPTFIAAASADGKKREQIEKSGAKLIITAEKDNHVDLADLMKKLGEAAVDSVLIEGGGSICASALKSKIVNSIQIYIAPKIMGGDGKCSIAPMGITLANNAIRLKSPKLTMIDDDILAEYEVE